MPLLNNLKVLESVKGREFADLKATIEKQGAKSLLAGQGVVVYTGKSYRVFRGPEFGELRQRRENERVQRKGRAFCEERG